MPSEREFEEALKQDPSHNEAFLFLRRSYRESGRFDKLVTLYETRAQAIADQSKAAELFYLAAEVRVDQLSDVSGAEADLAHAVSRDATHRKAAKRLKDIYREQGRAPEYFNMLEVEAAAVGKSGDATRIAELRAEIDRVYGPHIQKVEHALATPGRRAEVTPEHLKLVESARKVFAALGDYPSVCRLYEIELSATTDSKRRIGLMFRMGRVLAEKIGDLPQAAQRLSEVVRLYPRDDKALEALASVYANPNWTGGDGKDRAAGLYNQIARRRYEAGDTDNAIVSLRKALAAVPSHSEALNLLERVLTEASRFADLDRFLRERIATAQTAEEKIELLSKRARLAESALNDPEEAVRTYEAVVVLEEPGGPASAYLARLYSQRQDYAKLAELRERQLERTTDPAARLALLRELSALHRDRLGDREQAAVYLHAILQVDPSDAEALKAYADHFRQRGSFRELADLLEFAVEHDRGQGKAAAELLPRLEEVAVLAESKLADMDRALQVWRRMVQIDPSYERAREAQKRILQKSKLWDQMVPLLLEDVERATDAAQKVEILRRLARLHVEKLDAPDEAAKVYLQILALDPKDALALRTVIETYEKTENWTALAELLRAQEEMAASEAEKVGFLRRLLQIYEEKLNDPSLSSWAATQILKYIPGDRDALLRLEVILENSNDKPRLVKMLEYHLRFAPSADEKLRIVKRIAELLQDHLQDYSKAIPYWEKLLKHLPGDERSIEALLVAYENVGRPEDLARILDIKVKSKAEDPPAQAEALRRLARLAMSVLKEYTKAEDAWNALLALYPDDREALESLSTMATDMGDFTELVRLLERRRKIAEPAEAIELALQRALIYEEELREPGEAIAVLEHLIAEMDPNHRLAHQSLRRVAESTNDWQRVVNVSERLLAMTTEPSEQIEQGLEIGILCRDRLHDPNKAILAFERVLEIDPDQTEALESLAGLYEGVNDGERLLVVQDKMLSLTAEPERRRERIFGMAETALSILKDPLRAFGFLRKAHDENPDEASLDRLEKAAEEHGLWDALIDVYNAMDAAATEARDHVEIARKVAQIREKRQEQPTQAFAVLRDALVHDPAGAVLLPELERLARLVGDYEGLLGVYASVARGRRSPDERIVLLRLRARVREEDMQDASGALDECLRAFALDPDSQTSFQEILRLAELSGRWEDALKVEAQIFARATSVPIKIEIARRAAVLVETKLKDEVRAFRAYLNAFRLSPDDADIIDNLWRLASSIGRYDGEAGRLPLPKIPSAESDKWTAEAPAAEFAVEDSDIEKTPPPVAASEPTTELDPLEGTGEIDVVEIDILDEAPAPSDAPASGRLPGPRLSTTFETPWQEWVQTYEILPADIITRHRYLLKQAEIWEQGAEDIDRALEALERAFVLNPKDEMVCAEMERLAKAYDRWDLVCDVYLRAAERGQREEMVLMNLRVGRIREDLTSLEQAEERYRAVLVLDPSNYVALDRLETIYRVLERWSDLAYVLERRTTTEGIHLKGSEMRRRAFELSELYEQRLERPYEAVDTLTRYVASIEEEMASDDPRDESRDLVEEARRGYAALARLLGKVGMAQKAAAALQRELELQDDGPEAKQARMHLADLFERELGLPAKAIEVYEDLLRVLPGDADALAALDRLLLSTNQFEGLAALLDQRIAIADGRERSELIWRRARVLEEKLGNPDAAAACLRQLGPESLEDEETATALLRNLRSANLYHEALRLLEQRIDTLAKTDGDANLVSALYVQMAQIKADDLDDVSGGIQAIEAALVASPSDAPLLSELARFHLKRNDFQSYAATLLRKAEALVGHPDQVAVLLETAAVFRDQLGDSLQARVCFERAASDHPDNGDALGALASLEAAEGRLDEARELYERQLKLCDTSAAKAAVLTKLARVLCENPELLSEAEARLDEALEMEPGHLPAVITMADIYYREQQWNKAERRLNEALRRLRGHPEQTARLYHRLGEVYEKLGRLEEGYRQLLEADRAMPGQLMLRIALAENRFQAKRWREAAMHVEGIAEHEMAPQYSEEVAQALTHGALAELRLKRPERAALLNEAALHFQPSHPQTLRALADLAIERGDKLEAAHSLRRVAECSASQAERIQIFEQIGDLQLTLANRDAARAAYTDAVSMLEQASEAHIPLLEKLLGLERADGAIAEAIATARRIAEAVVDIKERAARRRDVATLQLEQGEPLGAAETLEKVLEDDPSDEIALHQLSDAYARAGRAADAAPALERLLPGLPETSEPEVAKQRSVLWEQLGTALALRNLDEGIAALEKAVAADPARISARVALARLYEQSPEKVSLATQNHVAILRVEPVTEASLRAVATTGLSQGRVDEGRSYLDLLALVGLANEDDRATIARYPLPSRATDEPFAGVLDEALRARCLADPQTKTLGEVFAALWEGLPSVNPITLEGLGVGAKDKVSAISDLDVAKIFSQAGKALGNQRAGLYLKPDDDSSLRLLPVAPTAVVVGAQLAESASVAELRFRIGRALEHLRPEYILAVTLDPVALDDLFTAVLKAFHPKHNRWRAGSEELGAEEAVKLKKALPYKFAKRIAEIFQERVDEELDLTAFRAGAFEAGNRAGLLLCGDIASAAALVLGESLAPAPTRLVAENYFDYGQKPGALKDLLRFYISPEHFELRQVLGVAVRSSSG